MAESMKSRENVFEQLNALGFEQVSQTLAEVITRPRKEREVAVFDFDNTCIVNDIGEIFSYYLVDGISYRYDLDSFWNLIDARDGRDELRRMVEAIQSSSNPFEHPLYDSYRSEMNAIYTRRLEREGKRDCYAWAVRLHVGLGEDAMVELSNRAIDAELAKPLERQTFLTSRGEEIAVERGIRMIHAIRELFRLLDANGIEVWICSATNIWTVREFAARYGVPRDRVIGNRVRVVDGVLTDELIEPVMFKEGKRAAIEREIGVRPTIVGGDSDTDFGMLEFAEFPLFLDTGTDSAYIEHATRNNWNVVTRHKLKVEESDG